MSSSVIVLLMNPIGRDISCKDNGEVIGRHFVFPGKDKNTMGQIKVTKNVGGIEGLCIIEPAVHGDERGYFMET